MKSTALLLLTLVLSLALISNHCFAHGEDTCVPIVSAWALDAPIVEFTWTVGCGGKDEAKIQSVSEDDAISLESKMDGTDLKITRTGTTVSIEFPSSQLRFLNRFVDGINCFWPISPSPSLKAIRLKIRERKSWMRAVDRYSSRSYL